MPRGYFITFEGLDGSGKTTQLRRLAATLEAEGHTVVTLRNPGGTALGDRIRSVLLDSRSEASVGPIAPAAEMALMFADRAQSIAEIVLPALAAGSIVLCDRYTDSSEAYQGGGRQLGSERILAMHAAACNNLQPDLTLLLLPSLESSLKRARCPIQCPLPFFMFRPWLNLGTPIHLFEYLLKTYVKIAHYRFMGTPIVFLNDPRYIQQVLVTDAQHFVKERTVRRMKVLIGEGLITSEDPIHLRQRRIAAPAFHRQRIAAYGDQIVSIAAYHRDQWQPGQALDISAASMALSLEIVARTLFDTDVTPDIRAINDAVNTIMHLYNFIVAFPRIESVLHLPIPGIVKFRRSKARLDAIVNRLIAEHRKSAVDKGDLLSMLLRSTYESTDAEPAAGQQPEHMSDNQV